MRKTFVLIFAVVALLGQTAFAENGRAAATTRVELAVDNMTCGVCPITVRKALESIPGVASVNVDYATKSAVVRFDPRKTSPDALTKATADAGYPSHVKQ